MPLRRDQVVRAALELLDEVGLDAFTTRALTDRLGVQRGALYWHVKSKQELLAAVTELIVRPVLADLDTVDRDWAEGYVGFAHRLREVMLAHRDGARLIAGHVLLRPGGLQRMEAGLARLAEQGVPPAFGARFGDTIASYVTGFVLQEQAMPPEFDFPADQAPPLVAAAMAAYGGSSAEVFAASVRTIVAGMRAEVADLADADQR
ncbi:MAG TPA: TetR/AcrR family transcriptional regulator C-terminal domain-containing protein [Pseudonocardiaceae bacterium]|jgi:TetR/AcrR family tetracycline transcriptional repressor|nr:TetR/AcrR family transcriptional regulator C-terminal domain-containing protein [Pseudonocardiaceae bacterium]